MRTSSARISGVGTLFVVAFMVFAVACVMPPAKPPSTADQGQPAQVAAGAPPQCRHEFAVTTTQDRSTVCKIGNGSLREAVMAANACPGRNLIDVPAGRYPLTLGSDLDITEEVTIIGAGRDSTVVVGRGGRVAVDSTTGGGSSSTGRRTRDPA